MNKKIWIIVAIVAVLAGGLTAGVMEARKTILFKDDKTVVDEAITGLIKNDAKTAWRQALDKEDLKKAMVEKGADLKLDVRLNSIGEASLNMLEGLTLSMGAKSDYKDKKFLVDFGGSYAGFSADAAVYADTDKIQMTTSLLQGKVFELAYSDGLYDKLKDSPLFGGAVTSFEEANGSSIKERMEEIQKQAEEGLEEGFGTKSLQKDLEDIKDNLIDHMEIKKDDKETFSINGKEKKCQGYRVTISKEVAKDFVADVIDVLYAKRKNMFQFAQRFADLDKQRIYGDVSGDGTDAMEDSNAVEDEIEQAKSELSEMIDQSLDEITMELYVTYYGELVSLEASTVVENNEYVMEIAREGESENSSNVKLQFYMKDQDNVKTGLTIEVEEEKKDKEIHQSVVLQARQASTYIELGTLEQTLDTQNGNISGECRTGSYISKFGYNLKLSYEGKIEDLKKDSVLNVQLDSVKFEQNDTELFDVSVGYVLQAVDKVQEFEGESKDILTMTQEEWQDVGANLTEILNGFTSMIP